MTTSRPKSSLEEVIDSARHGDFACQRVLSEAGRRLGKALATVVRIVGPSLIAVGGTLGRAGDIVLGGLRSSPETINLRAIGESPKFCLGEIGEDAPILGGVAAILAQIDRGLSELEPWMRQPVSAPAQDLPATP